MPTALNTPSLNIEDLPHRRMEAWKWTDMRARITDMQVGLSAQSLPHFDVPDGVSVSEISRDDLRTDSPMAELARQFGGSVWDITVPAGLKVGTPLMISNLVRGHARIRLTLEKGAQLNLIETLQGAQNAFSNLDFTITLKAGAVLNRVVVHDDPADHVRVATTHITAWKDARITQHCLSYGGALSRLETRLAAMASHVQAVLNGAYLLDAKRHCDITSYIDFTAPDCTINQAVKGVVTDKARGVFQGKFHVRRPAQRTDANMRHDALMLSDSAEIRSKPELEIYADDVACAHGNTLGQLDESALFYMCQRGIPLAQARALLTEAFVADVFDDLADDDTRESLLSRVREWLAETS